MSFLKISTIGCLLVVLSACYEGPRVDNLVYPGQESWLKGAVEISSAFESIDKLVVFGDSISDGGGLNNLTYFYFPDSVYWQSRPTNGPNWVDYSAAALGVSVANYAVAGASSRTKSFMDLFTPSVLRQVESYVDDIDDRDWDPSRDLAILWIGANNYLPKESTMTVSDTMDDIENAVKLLVEHGVKRILVATMPELAGLPQSPKTSKRKTDDKLRVVTKQHNHALREMFEKLKTQYKQVEWGFFHSYTINQQTIDNPSAFGFENLSAPCYRGDYQGRFEGEAKFCSKYFQYKFWDWVHSNSKMHCYYAAQFFEDLKTMGLVLANYSVNRGVDRCRQLTEKF